MVGAATRIFFFVVTSFVVTNVFVETKHVFCHNKSMLAAIIIMFVMTKDVFCYDKTFVMTKMMLVAAPANHTP